MSEGLVSASAVHVSYSALDLIAEHQWIFITKIHRFVPYTDLPGFTREVLLLSYAANSGRNQASRAEELLR